MIEGMSSPRPRPVVLTIMDGVGHNPNPENNAVAMANKPNLDRLWESYPHTLIRTDGPFVGLPDGQMGNSEVGHLNIGSGRVIQMDTTKIEASIDDGSIFENEALKASMAHAKDRALHLMGLVSDGGVHSHIRHVFALLEMAKREGVAKVFVHVFTDGRDTPPNSGIEHVKALEAKMDELGVGQIATVSGRYYAMDRDKRWERTERAFDAIMLGEGDLNASPVAAMQAAYDKGTTDEFIEPVVILDEKGDARGLLRDEDAVVFFNFRADRARQLTLAFNDAELAQPAREKAPKNLHYTTMTQYDKTYSYPMVIPPLMPEKILGEVVAEAGLKQLRTAETEKYPHVTFFFNGGREQPFEGEARELMQSPKVATYDLQPEMSADGVCKIVTDAIESDEYDLIVVNFANGDMVGHTGVIPAAVRAVEKVDQCLGKIEAALKGKNAAWIVTADHGNADLMINPETGEPHTYHTTFPVPLILVSEYRGELKDDGSLRDIAPTMLGLLGIEQPEEMTGRDLRD